MTPDEHLAAHISTEEQALKTAKVHLEAAKEKVTTLEAAVERGETIVAALKGKVKNVPMSETLETK